MTAEQEPESQPDSALTGSPKNVAEQANLPLRTWLGTQLAAAVLVAVILLQDGRLVAYSSLLGSMAAFLPAVFFAVYAGRKIGASSSAFLQAAVIGEAFKLALTAGICLVVFKWVDPLAPGGFIAGMVAVIAAGWIGLYRGMVKVN